jgi:hypothetical protein
LASCCQQFDPAISLLYVVAAVGDLPLLSSICYLEPKKRLDQHIVMRPVVLLFVFLISS